jgi:hypothetical protein
MPQLAGETILAEDIVPVRYFKKVATESVASSTTLQDDNDLAGIPLAANKIYLCQFYGAAIGDPAGDIDMAWALTGGAAELTMRAVTAPQIGVSDTTNTAVRIARNALSTRVPYGTTTSSVGVTICETFLVETTTAGTAGTLTLQWCQEASSATATQLTTNTFMIVTEIEAG